VIAGIAVALLERLGVPERVSYAGQTRLPGHGERRIVDRLLAGEEDAVAAELSDGRIDARSLERTGELVFTGW
jgi:predicted ABC-type transport system involved in lysophospholipase L1 biosynthesis ATPase subunit